MRAGSGGARDSAKRAFWFRSRPHFFLVDKAGSPRDTLQGVVPADGVRAAIDRLLGIDNR